MSAGWVAGAVRAKALVSRYPGAGGAREIARGPTLDDALRRLATTPYARYARTAAGLPQAQRAVAATVLWHLRVLAGWLPPGGARLLVPLAAGFEIANVVALLPAPESRRAEAPEPYRLGALETAWRSLERAGTPAELRAALTASPWGDPGGDTPWALLTGMRMAAARRTAVAVPSARRWAQGRALLLAARELFVHHRSFRSPCSATRHGCSGRGRRAPPHTRSSVSTCPRRPVGSWRMSTSRASCGGPRSAGGGRCSPTGRRCCARAGSGPGWSSVRSPY